MQTVVHLLESARPELSARRFQKLKSEIAQLEYFAKGTVLARMVKCGKLQCGCHTDPVKRHGPYYEWTYKEAGKTVNVRLDSKAASIYKAAARQYRKLKSTLNRMEKISRLALARIDSECGDATG